MKCEALEYPTAREMSVTLSLPSSSELTGTVEADLLEELVRRTAGDLAEQVRERARAQVDSLGHVVDRDRLGVMVMDIGQGGRYRVAARLLRSNVEHARELFALQHAVDDLLEVDGSQDPAVSTRVQALQEPDHDAHQLRVERRDHALLGRGWDLDGREARGRAAIDHVGRDLLDQSRVDLKHEREEGLAGAGLEDLRLEVQVAAEHEVVERIVGVGAALSHHGLAALSDDADRQRLDLFPGRLGGLVEPVDGQPRPSAVVAAELRRPRGEFGD